MERKILTAMILTVALAVFLTVYWLTEPQRIKAETEKMRLEAAAKGKALYMTHCARCHGEKGEPRRGIRPINSKDYLKNVDDIILYKIVERGIPGTGMAALGEKEGGPLNAEQIRDLVAFIRSWEKAAPAFPAEEAPPKKTFFVQEEAAYVGSESCIGCHEGLHPKAIDTWKKSPMAGKAFALIRDEKDKTKCTACHATGYDPEKKTYVEENVGCEACHGPGEKFQEMMGGTDAREGGRIAKENALKSCPRCHHPHIGKEEHIILARKGELAYP